MEKTIEGYLSSVSEEKVKYVEKLRECIKNNLPEGFEERISYGVIGYVVPHSIYPEGYHCNPKEALPFINIASQKGSINFYHLGLYGNKELFNWFISEYEKIAKHKISHGKSCIRFKYYEEIPYDLISVLVSKISVTQWIEYYQSHLKLKKR